MSTLKKKIIQQPYNYFLFIIFLLIGLIIYSDYGVSLDEDAYINNARIEYDFLKTFFLGEDFLHFYDEYFDKVGKFSNIFYLIVFFINDLFNFNIYSISHLLLFFVFLISCTFFAKIIFERFNDNLFAFISFFLFLSSPRFFAESFYNARDLFFLEMTIFFLYYFYKIIKNFTFINILLFSTCSAVCINIRFFGLIFFVTSIIFLFLEFEDKVKIKKLFYKIFQLIFLTFLILYIITPYLWLSPITNFIKFYFLDLQITSQIRVTNIFLGKLYSSQNSPYYYYIIWILFTIPFTFISLIFFGFFKKLFFYIKRLINIKENQNIWMSKNELFDFFVIFILALLIFIISRFSSIRVDGWRHLYFLYPFMLLCFYFFLNYIKKKIFIYKIILFILLINILFNLSWIVKNHPYQFVYFNFLNNFYSKQNFDLDYWGLTNYNMYKYILSNSTESEITIGSIGFNDLNVNLNLLEKDDRTRIKIIDVNNFPQYIIDNYRLPYNFNKLNNSKKYLSKYQKVHEIIVDNNIISTLYKILD